MPVYFPHVYCQREPDAREATIENLEVSLRFSPVSLIAKASEKTLRFMAPELGSDYRTDNSHSLDSS